MSLSNRYDLVWYQIRLVDLDRSLSKIFGRFDKVGWESVIL